MWIAIYVLSTVYGIVGTYFAWKKVQATVSAQEVKILDMREFIEGIPKDYTETRKNWEWKLSELEKPQELAPEFLFVAAFWLPIALAKQCVLLEEFLNKKLFVLARNSLKKKP